MPFQRRERGYPRIHPHYTKNFVKAQAFIFCSIISLMNKNSKASSIKQISKRFTTGNMKHLLADFAIIFLLIFFPVVGAPLVFFRRKES